MDWSWEKCFQLIDEYEKRPCLWDQKNGLYYHKGNRNEAWQEISEKINVPVEEGRRKMDSLLASFRREKAKERRCEENGVRFSSKWFGYQKLLFLIDRDELKDDSVVYRNDEDETIDDSQPEDKSETADDFLPPPAKVSRTFKRPYFNNNDNNDSRGFRSLQSEDSCSTYGRHIANKLRNYDLATRCLVEHKINEIIFQADFGQIQPPSISNLNHFMVDTIDIKPDPVVIDETEDGQR